MITPVTLPPYMYSKNAYSPRTPLLAPQKQKRNPATTTPNFLGLFAPAGLRGMRYVKLGHLGRQKCCCVQGASLYTNGSKKHHKVGWTPLLAPTWIGQIYIISGRASNPPALGWLVGSMGTAYRYNWVIVNKFDGGALRVLARVHADRRLMGLQEK